MQEWYDALSALRGIRSADDVEKFTKQFRPGYDRLLSKELPIDKMAPIYDVGCGPGLTLNILRSLGYQTLEGTDLSGTAIQIAQSLGIRASVGDSILGLESKPDHEFAGIFAIDLIEHLERKDLVRLLAVARKKLRADGLLVLRFPNGDSPFVGRHLFNDATHLWTYTSAAISSLLAIAGFGRVQFLDEGVPFINDLRPIRVPIRLLSRSVLRSLFRAASGETIECFSASFWTIARI